MFKSIMLRRRRRIKKSRKEIRDIRLVNMIKTKTISNNHPLFLINKNAKN